MVNTKISKEKVPVDKNCIMYVGKDGFVWQAPRKGKTADKKKIGTEKITRRKGFMVFVDKDGYVCETEMKKRVKGEKVKKAPAAKKADPAKKPVAKTAPAKK
jgi:hypothetical protein